LSTVPRDPGAAVIGGGPAGAAAAAALCRAGVEVVVVDGSDRGGSFRVGESAPPGTERAIADAFGVGSGAFTASRHLPFYGNRAAWGSSEPAVTDFILNPFGHGWHLDRAAFDRDLMDGAAALGARVLTGRRVRAAERHGSGWRLRIVPVKGQAGEVLAAERVVEARFLCDASGRGGAFGREQGATLRTGDRLVAVVALLEPGAGPDSEPRGGDVGGDGTTLIEATEDGWWYTAAVPRGRRVLAFFSDGDLLDPVALRATEGFAECLAGTGHVRAAAGHHGGRLTRPRLVAAGTAWLDPPAGPGWLATGDAAVSFDPLSSQGILSALVMGRRAGEALAERLSSTQDEPLDRYADDYARLRERYRVERDVAYGMERRWPASPFWRRRHGAAAGGPH
jgi:flavin-dependent dehydrogenase